METDFFSSPPRKNIIFLIQLEVLGDSSWIGAAWGLEPGINKTTAISHTLLLPLQRGVRRFIADLGSM